MSIFRRNNRLALMLGLLMAATLVLTACPAAAPAGSDPDTGSTSSDDNNTDSGDSGIGDRDPNTLVILYWQAASLLMLARLRWNLWQTGIQMVK